MTLSHYNSSRGGETEFQFYYDDSKHQATVKSILIGRIIEVGTPCSFSGLDTIPEAIPTVREARQLAGLPDHVPASYQTASEEEKNLWRTLCGNLAVDYAEGDRGWKLADPTTNFDSYSRWYNSISTEQDIQPSEMKHEPFLDALTPNLSGRRFIRTDHGDIGMAHAEARSDDIAMVLAGGKVPYTLRQEIKSGVSKGHELYRLIGDVYIDDKMEGEAVSNGEWTEVTLI